MLSMQSALYRIKSFMLMTVRGPAERSSRFYTENVQQYCRTYKKPKCFLLHPRHPLPAADCGKGKEGLTAICNSVRSYYNIRRRTLSMNRLFRRFFLIFAPFRLYLLSKSFCCIRIARESGQFPHKSASFSGHCDPKGAE